MRLPRFTKPYHLKDYKFNLVVLVIALSILGVLAVGSAKEVYQSRQIVGMIIGIIAMVIVSLIDYVWAVSYTHLDVYKRQAMRTANAFPISSATLGRFPRKNTMR